MRTTLWLPLLCSVKKIGSARFLKTAMQRPWLRMLSSSNENGITSKFVANQPLHKTLMDAIWKHSVSDPQKIAFMNAEDNSLCITYRQLYLYAQSVSAFLERQNFKHGDIACMVLPNCWQYAAFFLGTSVCGGAISGASYHFSEYELEQQFTDSKCKVVLTDEHSMAKVLNAAKKCTQIHCVIVIPKDGTSDHGTHRFPAGVISWSTVLAEQPNMYKNKLKQNPALDIVALPYSSGTTGKPKGVMLSHRNIGTMLNVVINHLSTVVLDKMIPKWNWYKDKIFLILPFYHIYGFGILCMVLIKGSTSIVFQRFEGEIFCQNIQQHKIRFLMIVPPILGFLAKSPTVSKYDLSSVVTIICGAAPLGKGLCDDVQKRHKNLKYVLQGYGMTEVGMVSHLPDCTDEQHYASCGKLAHTYEQKIVNVETGKECEPGESGEILLRGPTIMLGYWNRPESTAETIDRDGWLHTGDIGYVDENGYLFIVDRLKELIKVSGLQVPPAEIEDVLLSHPKICDAAVVGIPDEKSGELPRAFVVRKDDQLSENDVAEFANSKLSYYKHLKGGVYFVDEIPRLSSGKILRRHLRDQTIDIDSLNIKNL